MPLCYRRVADTMADVPAVRALIRDMGPSLAGEVRLVMDRGFWSAANVNAMMRGHLKFLMGVPTSLGLYADAVDGHGAELRTRRNLDPSTGLYGMRLAHGWDHGEARPQGRRRRDEAPRPHLPVLRRPWGCRGGAAARGPAARAGLRAGGRQPRRVTRALLRPVLRGEEREARRQGRGHRGGHGSRGVLCAVLQRGHPSRRLPSTVTRTPSRGASATPGPCSAFARRPRLPRTRLRGGCS